MVAIPPDVRPDLAERYRQLRPFDEAEVALVHALVERPDRLPRTHEVILRQALNLARLWVISSKDPVVVGPQLGTFRDRVRPLADRILRAKGLDPRALGTDAQALEPHLRTARDGLRSQFLGRLDAADLERELTEKALVLAVGGGGGCGYVHLGTFSVLESLGLTPKLISGSSIGSILGLFRAREVHYRDETVRAVTHGLTFKKIFRILDAETRYAMPGALRLYLRSALSRFFIGMDGETQRLQDMPIPFICVVTGVRREAVRQVDEYERMFRREIRRGALGRLLHLKDMMSNVVSLLSELVATPGALTQIPLGAETMSQPFDVIDAVGFSSALPVVIQYDITRDDPRMHGIMRSLMEHHGVDYFADGGIAANVPARAAWEYVQSGHLGTRNAFILGLDCFAPQIGRNVLFLPLQRIAAENVTKERGFAQHVFTYRWTLSPTSLVPKRRAVDQAIRRGKAEFAQQGPFVQKMLEPLTLP
ncbi:MAG: patatin-like phospholipase family protein [Deltaproteobacteria bacterium]